MLHPGLVAIFPLNFGLTWYSYYHSYYNPLLGGSYVAPRPVKGSEGTT